MRYARAVVALVALIATGCAPSGPAVVPEPTSTPPAAIDTAPVDAAAWPPALRLVQRWTGFELPVGLTHAGDGTGDLYIVEQTGTIRRLGADTQSMSVFLDVRDRVSTGGERGLLGLAFAPDYPESGVFYLDYTDTGGHTVIARFRSTDGVGDPSSEQIVLRVKQPYANHNGGQIAFGPDGYLYIGMGDGGSGGDPAGNAQNGSSLLGKMLRIDVTGAIGTPDAYRVPADNPFAGNPAFRPEIWALGLRNPWRFSFDRGTGELYIADVGQNAWEEIDVEPAAAGGRNYGWNIFEGSHTYPPKSARPGNARDFAMPVVEYDHSAGKSVTGGFVYRGERYPDMRGVYLYADYVTGRVWGLARVGGTWKTSLLLETGLNPSSFGEDASGTLYLLDHSSGTIFEIAE